MATKAELEKQLAELQAQAAVRKPAFEEAIDINTAQKILGVNLIGLARTKDKKLQALQQDVKTLAIAMATVSVKLGGLDVVRPEAAAPKEAQA